MKPSQIRPQEPKEIGKTVEEKHREVFDLRLKKATGQLSDRSALGKTKRDIARLLTILKEKEAKA